MANEQNDHINDDFFESLAGNKNTDEAAVHLREIILDELAQVETQHGSSLLPQQKIDQLQQQLINEGVFRENPSKKNWIESIVASVKTFFDSLSNTQMAGGFASVAAITMVALSLLNQMPMTDPNDPLGIDVIRGNGAMIIQTKQATSLIEQLQTTSSNNQAEVTIAQISDTEWSVNIEATSATNIQSLKNELKAQGINVEGEPPYALTIRQQ